MALPPAVAKVIAKVIISQLLDEEKRQRLIIGIIVAIVVSLLIILVPIFILTETLENIKIALGFSEEDEVANNSYTNILEVKNKYGNMLESEELVFKGVLPMPVNNVVVTSEFGTRVDPISGKQSSFHTGIDMAGKWHCNILSVLSGKVVFASVQNGYGNCIQIEHTYNGTTFYTFYAHMADIYVSVGQEVEQGNIIGTQGGDPEKDKNAGWSTGTHLHFEIRKTKSGDFINPRTYLFNQ